MRTNMLTDTKSRALTFLQRRVVSEVCERLLLSPSLLHWTAGEILSVLLERKQGRSHPLHSRSRCFPRLPLLVRY
jgi:hypothetical protein